MKNICVVLTFELLHMQLKKSMSQTLTLSKHVDVVIFHAKSGHHRHAMFIDHENLDDPPCCLWSQQLNL